MTNIVSNPFVPKSNILLVQYYLPPKTQVNKDFLKQVFTDEKLLLKKKNVDYIDVPKYDELSVKNLWPSLAKDKKFVVFFPDNWAESKGPSRKYFFDILNTVHPEYLQQIVSHANEVRMSAGSELNKTHSIKITDEWNERLHSLPYLSCKCPQINIYFSFYLFKQRNQARPSTCSRKAASHLQHL